MQWNDVAFAFEVDGSLRDIYAYNTTAADWNRLLTLSNEIGKATYRCNGENAPFPSSSDTLLDDRNRSHCLEIDLGGPIANAHFFTTEEIELDLDPSQIGSQREFDVVREFCVRLAHEIERDVVITAENTPDIVFLCYAVNEGVWRVSQQA